MARVIIAVIIALFAIITYFSSTSENPLTGEKQRVAMTPEQEIALGYQSAPQMAAQMGGISRNAQAVALVQRVGEHLVRQSVAAKSPYKFSFHVLADPKTVNAFALPGGPVFITEGLLRLLKSEAELAGVLGHEISHVTRKHHLNALRKGALVNLLGEGLAASSDKHSELVRQLAGPTKELYARGLDKGDEFEADRIGVVLAARAGYDPYGLPAVLTTLATADPNDNFLSLLYKTHPLPQARLDKLAPGLATLDSLKTPQNADRFQRLTKKLRVASN
jgi:predicted Zn-dependent protease